MKILKKTKAFTLMEMLIVLAITSIVAGLAFAIVSMLGRNVQLIHANYDRNTELHLLEQQIVVDMNSHSTIRYDRDAMNLQLSSPLDSLRYQFSNSEIIRENDTLYNDFTVVECYFMGKPVDNGYIDAIKLAVDSIENKFLFISKRNDALQHLKANGN